MPGLEGESKSLSFSTVLVYLNYVCFWIIIMIVVLLACAFTWLTWHQANLKCNTRAFAVTYHALLVGTTRASQECGQIRRKACYTLQWVLLTKNRLWAPFLACKNFLKKSPLFNCIYPATWNLSDSPVFFYKDGIVAGVEDVALFLLGEDICWSLLGLKRLTL